MADVVLAEFSGSAWLVRGEQHIDDLLANTMDPDVSIEVVTCESKSAVDDLWRQWNDDDPAMMWLIHPAIVNRARTRPGEMVVTFAPWSAALDDMALQAIRAVAGAVDARPGATLTLVQMLAAEAPPMAVQMANLRCSLLEAQFAAHSAAPVARATRAAERQEDADRILLVLQP